MPSGARGGLLLYGPPKIAWIASAAARTLVHSETWGYLLAVVVGVALLVVGMPRWNRLHARNARALRTPRRCRPRPT